MEVEIGVYIIALVVTVLISWAIAEFFGRAKHIGFGWTFALSATTIFIGGIIALIASPSADEPAPPRREGQAIAAWIFFIFGGLGLFTLNPLSLGFFVLGGYIWELSKGEIKNSNPKFYFRSNSATSNTSSQNKRSNQETTSRNSTFQKKSNQDSLQEKKNNLQNLYDKGLLTEDEYRDKLQALIDYEFNLEVKRSQEYHQLKKLFDDGILTSNEFENKVGILKTNLRKGKEQNFRSFMTLKGFKKAVEIYNVAIFKNNGEMMEKLSSKLETLLNTKKSNDSKSFIQDILEKYNSTLNNSEKVKIISTISNYSNNRTDMDGAQRYFVKFINNHPEREFWMTRNQIYAVIINGRKEFYSHSKECLNYLTNNE